MNIVEKKDRVVKFCEIGNGDIFEKEECLYIKIPFFEGYYTGLVNAYDLRQNIYDHFEDDEKVIQINADLMIR